MLGQLDPATVGLGVSYHVLMLQPTEPSFMNESIAYGQQTPCIQSVESCHTKP